jgi:hypothetical protein
VASPVLLGDPVIRELIGLPAGPGPITDNGGGGGGGGEPEDAEEPRGLPEATPQTEEQAALVAVAKLSVTRALSLAGGRLVPHRHRDRYPGTPRWQLHSRHGPVTRDRAEEVLRGAWEDLAPVAGDLGVDGGALEALLHGFCVELLCRGMAYEAGLVRDLLTAAAPRGKIAARCAP